MIEVFGRPVAICLAALVACIAPAAEAGTIRGQVMFEGKAPMMRAIQVEADPVCAALHEEPPRTEWLVLDEDQNVAHVLVQVVRGLPDETYPVPEEPSSITQKGCQYTPHLLAVRAGQEVKILNPDGTLHNSHVKSKVNREFNKAMQKQRKEIVHVFDEPEPVFVINCDVHPWMKAYAVVFDHPYFAVTAKDGTYAIEGLPPGTYEVEFWHERLGVRTETVTVSESNDAEVNIVYTRPGSTN